MRKEILSEEEVRQAYERWLGGEALPDIAESLFVGQSTLERSFRRRKLKKGRKSACRKNCRFNDVDKHEK